MNTDPIKTAAWMRSRGVLGTDEQVAQYAQDWLDVRAETGVALDPVPGLQRLPDRATMRRKAEHIDRERTRTRVIDGYRVWGQARDAVWFGRHQEPGVWIGIAQTDEPAEHAWTVVSAGHVGLTPCPETPTYPFRELPVVADETFRAPVTSRFDPTVRNNMGDLGAFVDVWLEGDEWESFLHHCVRQLIAASRKELANV
jgi:hypothetical protein